VLPSLDAPSEPIAASMQELMKLCAQEPAPRSAEVEAPKLVPEQGPTAEVPKLDASKTDAHKVDAPDFQASESGTARAAARRAPARIMIMSAGDRAWPGDDASSEPVSEPGQG